MTKAKNPRAQYDDGRARSGANALQGPNGTPGKLLRASTEQWEAWQELADAMTGGDLSAFLRDAADSKVASAATSRLRVKRYARRG